ncbi:MAG: hypothetical protein NVSMB52_12720 [Chloroflexota bacterium]
MSDSLTLEGLGQILSHGDDPERLVLTVTRGPQHFSVRLASIESGYLYGVTTDDGTVLAQGVSAVLDSAIVTTLLHILEGNHG